MYLIQRGKSLIEEHLSLCPLLPQYRVRIRLEAALRVQTFLFPIFAVLQHARLPSLLKTSFSDLQDSSFLWNPQCHQ